MKNLMLMMLYLCASENTYSQSNPLLVYKDVKPILEKKCGECHGSNWPEKNWSDEKITKQNSSKIKERLQNKTMPPGNFTELSEEQRKLIIKWVEDGAN